MSKISNEIRLEAVQRVVDDGMSISASARTKEQNSMRSFHVTIHTYPLSLNRGQKKKYLSPPRKPGDPPTGVLLVAPRSA